MKIPTCFEGNKGLVRATGVLWTCADRSWSGKATYIKAAGPGMRAELIGHVMHGQIAPIVALPLFSG